MAAALSAQKLLDIWERGIFEKPFKRALMMASAVYPEVPVESLSALSLGQMDALLLSIRKALFGPRIIGIARCKRCSEPLEIAFNVEEIALDLPADPTEIMEFSYDGFIVRFRLPNSSDLIAASDQRDVASFRANILKRCLGKAARGTEEISFEELPEVIINKIVALMERADPQADIQITLDCPICSSEERVAFDVAQFLWSEMNAWAVRTLREVHILASAYGWNESEILAISPWRRQFYLEVLNR